jgi:hypothetical protein
VCRRVQVERPSCSTSGGQLGGGPSGWRGAWAWGRERAGVRMEVERVDFLAWEAQSAKEVQDLQL